MSTRTRPFAVVATVISLAATASAQDPPPPPSDVEAQVAALLQRVPPGQRKDVVARALASSKDVSPSLASDRNQKLIRDAVMGRLGDQGRGADPGTVLAAVTDIASTLLNHAPLKPGDTPVLNALASKIHDELQGSPSPTNQVDATSNTTSAGTTTSTTTPPAPPADSLIATNPDLHAALLYVLLNHDEDFRGGRTPSVSDRRKNLSDLVTLRAGSNPLLSQYNNFVTANKLASKRSLSFTAPDQLALQDLIKLAVPDDGVSPQKPVLKPLPAPNQPNQPNQPNPAPLAEDVLDDVLHIAGLPDIQEVETLAVDASRLFGGLAARCRAKQAVSGTRGVILARPARSARYILVDP